MIEGILIEKFKNNLKYFSNSGVNFVRLQSISVEKSISVTYSIFNGIILSTIE